MASFLDTLDDEVTEEPIGFALPDEDDTRFLDTLDDETVTEELALPEEPVTTISAYEPTIFDRMRRVFKDPAKEGAEAVQALVDSTMLDISPSNALRLRGPIGRGVEINPAAAKLRSSLIQTVGDKLDRGYAQVNSGLWNFDDLTGKTGPEVTAGIKQTEEYLAQPEAIPETRFEEAVASAAEMFPFLAESFKHGGYRGVILAGGTVLMGTVAGVPEVAYPLAAPMYAVGQTSASLEFVSKVEAGLAYSELRNFKDPETGERIDTDIARAAAFGVGAINGLLEYAQLKTLIKTLPGGKKLLSGLILDTVKEVAEKKSLQAIAGKYAARYGKMITTETLQETAQESTNIVADIFARKLTNELKGTDLSLLPKDIVDPVTGETITGWNQIIHRLGETAKTSAQAFAVMGIPGPVVSAGYDIAKQREAVRAQEMDTRERIEQIARTQNLQALKAVMEPPVAPVVDYFVADDELVEGAPEVDLTEILGYEAAEDAFIKKIMVKAGFEIPVADPEVVAFADRMVAGEPMEALEDIQFYENNAAAIEAELATRRVVEEDVPVITEPIDVTSPERVAEDLGIEFKGKVEGLFMFKDDITGSITVENLADLPAALREKREAFGLEYVPGMISQRKIAQFNNLRNVLSGMSREVFNRTELEVGSNLKETLTRVVYAEDNYRLTNLRNHIPVDRQTPIIKSKSPMVKIYRAVRGDFSTIRPGDWVAVTKSYAKKHIVGRKDAKILEVEVPREDVVWAGTDENEFFYAPRILSRPDAKSTFDGITEALAEEMPQAAVGPAAPAAPAQPFHSSRIVNEDLRNAVESGLLSTEEGAVYDGIMSIVGEKGWDKYFDVRISGQRFTPSKAQLKAHGIPESQAGLYQLEGVLLTEQAQQAAKTEAQNIAVIFQGGDVTTFFHEFGEFAYKRLLTGEGDKATVTREYKASGSKLSENEWFSDNFRDWWVNTLAGESDIVSQELHSLYQKMVAVIKQVWTRIKSLGTPTPAIDELFTDIITKGREVEFGTGRIVVPEMAPGTVVQPADVGVEPPGLREYRLTQRALKEQTGQVPPAEDAIEAENLRLALKMTARNARRAHAAGNKAGVAKEKKRMAAILERAKQRRKDAAANKKVKDKITKELEVAKVKKKAGKPRGRYGAERQVTLDLMRSWVIGKDKLTKEQARELLGDRVAKQADSEMKMPTEWEFLENRLLEMIGAPIPDLASNEKLLNDIKAFKFTGEMERERKKQNRLAYLEMITQEVIDIVGGVDPRKKQIGGKVRPEEKAFRQRIRNLLFASGATNFVQAWDDLLDILSYRDVTSKPGESIISKFGSVHFEEKAEMEGNMVAMESMQKIVMETYGLKSTAEMTKMFDKDSVQVNLGTFKDLNNNPVEMVFTKAEARKAIMALLDPSLHDTFFSEKGAMHWSPEMVGALYDMMTAQDLEFIQKQMDWYQDYYASINEVYKEIYGGSIKSRVTNYKPITQQSDISVLMRHVMEMEHFKAWSQKIRDLNAVFNHPEVRAAIEENFGRNINKHLEDTIQGLASGGNERSNMYGFFDRMRIRYTQSVLALKPVSLFVKQLASVLTGADFIPIASWSKEFTKMANPIHLNNATKELFKESVKLRHRWERGAVERDIAAAVATDEYKAFKAKPSFMNKLMFAVRLGDISAIILGGYPVYKYYLNKTGNKEEAIRHFENFMDSTQQSSNISKLSALQRGNAFMKLFTMFLTTPIQYFRKELGALRNLSAGRISTAKFMKTIIIYHFVLPLIFQTMSELIVGGDEDEDALVPWLTKGQKRAMILGSFNGYVIIGTLLDYTLKKTMGIYAELPSIAPAGAFRDLAKALRLFDWDDLSDEEVLEAIRGLAGAVAASPTPVVGGMPLKQVVDIGTGVSDILSGEWEKGLLEVGGWSPYAAEKATE
jgi:hypothetical protein